MARLFGTDGVRGVVNEFLTPELAYHLGRAAATHFGKEKEHPTFLIGRDTRISGSMLECALASGICSVGGNVVMAGVIPTPAVAYLVKQQDFDAGALFLHLITHSQIMVLNSLMVVVLNYQMKWKIN